MSDSHLEPGEADPVYRGDASKDANDAIVAAVLFEGTMQEGYPCYSNRCAAVFSVSRSWRGVKVDTVTVSLEPPDNTDCIFTGVPWNTGRRYLIWSNSAENSEAFVSLSTGSWFSEGDLKFLPEFQTKVDQIPTLTLSPESSEQRMLRWYGRWSPVMLQILAVLGIVVLSVAMLHFGEKIRRRRNPG